MGVPSVVLSTTVEDMSPNLTLEKGCTSEFQVKPTLGLITPCPMNYQAQRFLRSFSIGFSLEEGNLVDWPAMKAVAFPARMKAFHLPLI